MPTLIRMTAKRRGNIGGNRYRTFEVGETYTVTDTPSSPDTVTPFLADQFIQAGEAVEVDASKAPEASGASDSGESTPPEKALAQQTKAELIATAEAEGVDLSNASTNPERIAAIEAHRSAAAGDSGKPAPNEPAPREPASDDGE